ncbi:TPA: helix-turn-helix domain-containing protein [Bacillus cereus]|uniref:helix-turn-helix domain-containing protein n=1 Tax=Bacillus TaxID=1386 RepID=UPI000CD9DAEF|nr:MULTISPECIES: helix-turn-helix domain-containing protein [Bacillus]QCC42615.1 transcriptional regulator [Bacillus sp. DU-106]QUW36296.1 helix-turn-helix domain-containing protein [Bacillus cereus]HDR3902666.1 helix-turn-helix domain-containing protein [Bacillus cereus]
MQPQDIRTIRQLTGLNQTEFAKLLGVALLTVNRWEKGHTQPKKENIKRIESLIGSDNLRVIQSKLLYDLPLLEASDSLRKRVNDKKGEVKR